MKITETSALPHDITHLRTFLRVTHSEEDEVIIGIYRAALRQIQARTRRYIAAGTIEFSSGIWHTELHVPKHFAGLTITTKRYEDTDGHSQQLTPTVEGRSICLGPQPADFAGTLVVKASIQPFTNDALMQALLMLTAQWYENRGDQALRGVPLWIDKICGTHAYQRF